MIKLRIKRDTFGKIVTDEAGSALILALAFLIFFSMVGAALLAFVDTGFKGSVAVKDQRKTSYAADGGIEGAIKYIQDNADLGIFGETCPDFELNDLNGATVTVTCAPYEGSGALTGGSSSVTNTPESAVLTLGDTNTYQDDDQTGLHQKQNGELRINGPVFSNSHIIASGGSQSSLLVNNGPVFARSCTGTIAPACTITSTVKDDPAYASLATSSFVDQVVPPCIAGVRTLTQGRYTSADELNASCDLFLFTAGVYFFDFQDSGNSSKRVWTLDSDDAVRGGIYDSITQSCLPGVQFIFGSESQWKIQRGTVELCALTPVSDGQRIAIYGAGSIARLRSTRVINTTSTNSQFTPTNSALDIDGVTASATLSGTSTGRTAALRLNGYLGSIPAGANISSARIKVAHRERPNASGTSASNATLTLNVTGTVGSASTFTSGGGSNLTTADNLHTDVIALPLGGAWDNPARYANGVTITYQASVGTGRNLIEQLDGIWLEVTYAPAPLKAASGCLIATSGGCPLITISNNPGTSVVVTGSAYAPASVLDISLNNVQAQVFNRGVIVRGIRANITGSSSFTGNAIGLPSGGGTAGTRTVLLTAYVSCSPPSGCKPKVRAKVRFPVPPAVSGPMIDYWTVLRE